MSTASAFSVGGTFLSAEQKAALEATATAIATPGKGITACDEGPGTIGARFEAVGVENTEENRRKYRQMLFEAPGCEKYLSAAILDPETLYQKSDTSGKLFPEVLTERGIVPGIKPHLKVRGGIMVAASCQRALTILY
jgi:fructose-bisphosphate aldolase class I